MHYILTELCRHCKGKGKNCYKPSPCLSTPLSLYETDCSKPQIKFPFKRKACQVHRVGYGRGRVWLGRGGGRGTGRVGKGRIGSELSHFGSRWFVHACN